jgi:branched-chain amino acid transport system substrate-binding protein
MNGPVTSPSRRLRVIAAGATALLLVSASACGDDSSNSSSATTAAPTGTTVAGAPTTAAPASGGKPYKIVYVSGLTGVLASSGKAAQRGAQAAVDELNDGGGIGGRKIEMTSKDNQSDPTQAVSIVQGIIDSGSKPDLVVAGVSSNEGLAMAPLFTRNKIIGIGESSSQALNDPVKYPYYFSGSALQKDVLGAAVAFIVKQGTAKKVSLVLPNDALGDAEATAIKASFADKGVTVSDNRFAGDAVDISPTFQKAMSSSPDWIFTDGAGGQVAHILEGRTKAGAEKIPTVGGVVMATQPLLKLAGPHQLDNLKVALLPTQKFVEPADRGPQFTALLKRVNAQGPLETVLYTYEAGWDMVMLWAAGVKNAGGDTDPDKLKASLENLPKSTDPQFPLYKTTYSAATHFPTAKPEEVTFGELVDTKEGMFVTK